MVGCNGKMFWSAALEGEVPQGLRNKSSWQFSLGRRTYEERFTRFFTD
jgi:hypothetical protein